MRGVRGVGGGGWVGESRVRWVGGGGRWTWGVLGAEGDRIWRGGIAVEMEGDRGGLHKFFLAFKKLFDTYLCLNMFKLV